MRTPFLTLPMLAAALLCGCEALSPDALASAATGRRCAANNLREGTAYCRAEAPPATPVYCTRSRGSVDCWKAPPEATPPYRPVADGPATLNAEQEEGRQRPGARLF